MTKRSKKRSRVIGKSVKPRISTKDAREEIAVNIIYLMEKFKDAAILLNRRGKLTDDRKYTSSVREDMCMMILFGVIGVEKEFVRKIATNMKTNIEWWEKEVESFVETIYDEKMINIVTPDAFEKELAETEKRKATQKRLLVDSNILSES